MFQLRRTAFRLLANPSTSFVCRSRSITTFSRSAFRSSHQTSLAPAFQRRWASENAVNASEETPIQKVEPTAEEEVENAEITENTESEADTTKATQGALDNAKETASEVIGSTFDKAHQAASFVGAAVSGGRESTTLPGTTLYVGNLFFDVNDQDLQKEFSRFGQIVSTRIVRDGREFSKGFGYVVFKSAEDATKAMEVMNLSVYEGRRITVQPSHRDSNAPRNNSRGGRSGAARGGSSSNPPSKTLFLGNLSFEMTDRDLNDLFKGIRNVIDVRVAIDRRTGQPRGFAHADFIDVQSAVEAHDKLKDKETYGRRLRVDYTYSKANPEEDSAPQEKL